MKMVEQEVRKGPWTEEEDLKLVSFVGLFGDRRWDFIAKVSGLNRTGKSCRLRWVNYLHPGLKRGKMTSQEERLILELHSKWGNRWSRIARKLPGRTDNEIKNYWRTLMRKKAQEKKRAEAAVSASASASASASTPSAIIHSSNNKVGGESFYDTGTSQGEQPCLFSMDDIWKDIIDMSGDNTLYDSHTQYYSDPLCLIDDQTFFCPMPMHKPPFF